MPPYQHTNPRKTSRTKSALIPLPAPVSPHVPWDEHQSTSFSSPSEMCLLLHPPRVRLLLSHSGINNELNSSSLRSAQVAHLSASISPVHPTTTRPPTRHPFRGHPVFQQAAQEGRLPIPQDLESRVSKFPVPPLRRALILRSIPFLENCCHQSYLRTRRHAKKNKKKNISYQERTPNPLLKTSLRSKRHLLLPRSHQSADNHNRGSTYITLHVIRRIQHALLTEARPETLDDPRITIRKLLFSLRLYPHQERNPLQKTTRPRKALHSSLPNRKTST